MVGFELLKLKNQYNEILGYCHGRIAKKMRIIMRKLGKMDKIIDFLRIHFSLTIF